MIKLAVSYTSRRASWCDDDPKSNDYNISNRNQWDEDIFTTPRSMDIKFTAYFEIIPDKLAALYKQLNVTDDPDYFNLNGCNYTKNTKKVTGILEFDTCNQWVPSKHQIGKFLTITT